MVNSFAAVWPPQLSSCLSALCGRLFGRPRRSGLSSRSCNASSTPMRSPHVQPTGSPSRANQFAGACTGQECVAQLGINRQWRRISGGFGVALTMRGPPRAGRYRLPLAYCARGANGTTFSRLGDSQNAPQASMRVRRLSRASPRRYARSTSSPTRWAKAASATSRGNVVRSPAQSRKALRKPCTVTSTCARRSTISSAMLDSGWPPCARGIRNRRCGISISALSNLDGAVGKWHPVLARSFHPRWPAPSRLGVEVEFVPPRAQHFAGSRCSQDRELKSHGRDTIHLPQPANEFRYVIEWHSLVMPARELLALRQQGVEVSAPPRRILAGTHPTRLGEVEDALNAAAQPRGRFRLGEPQGFQDAQNVIRGDVRHR